MNLLKIIVLTAIFIATGQQLHSNNHHITVFVHGTSQAGLGLLNFRRIWHDLFDGSSWYEHSLLRARTDPFLEKSDLMLGMGLVDVTDLLQLPALDPTVRHRAAIHIIRAYDALARTTNPTTDEQHYYTFGWLGIMSERGREQAAEHLYAALTTLKKEYTDRGDTVTFTLHAHSHGGQLVLHLAHIRKEHGDTDFVIDQAILSATPLYYHKARYANSGMFTTIINFYSEGDNIQTADRFSTPTHSCKRTFVGAGIPLLSGNTPSPHIIDARLCAYGRSDIFGHACFFILDRYLVLNYVPRKQRKAIRTLLKQMHPLPLVALYPVMVPAMLAHLAEIGSSGYQKFDCNFMLDAGELVCALLNKQHTTTVSFPLATVAAARAEVTAAYANTTYQNEARKALHSFKHIFGSQPTQQRA